MSVGIKSALVGASVSSLIVATLAASVLTAQGIIAFEDQDNRVLPLPPPLVEVRSGSVRDEVSIEIESMPVRTINVGNYVADAGGVITREGPSAASPIGEGESLLTIDEKPLLMFQGSVPAYRSLSQGISGVDVAQLQDALKRFGYDIFDRHSVFGPSTSLAIWNYFTDRGLQPLAVDGSAASHWRSTSLPLPNLIFMPSFPVALDARCGSVGIKITEIECDLNTVEGQTVAVVPNGVSIPGDEAAFVFQEVLGEVVSTPLGQELSADAFGSSENSEIEEISSSRYFIVDSENNSLDSGPATLVLRQSEETSLQIPVAAVRDDGDGAFFVTSSAGQDIPVEIGFCSGGLCAAESSQLRVGMMLRESE